MKKLLGAILVLAVFASIAAIAQTTVTNRGEVITVYTMEDLPESTETNTDITEKPWNVEVRNDATVKGDLAVEGSTTVSNVAASGTLAVTGSTTVSNVAASGTLDVTGNATVSNVTASGDVVVSGATASQAVFTDENKKLVSNDVTGTGDVVMSASPTLTGTVGAENITASGTLDVTGVATFTAAPKLTAVTAEGAETATMTNAPAAGNPVAWANVSIGTNTYVIPLFAAE